MVNLGIILDHIAMLVRGRNNSLNFIEASESIGVRVFPIQELFKDDNTDVLVYRKLEYKFDDETLCNFKKRLVVM